MRNSRKYINPSINGSRNIFTSYDEVPNGFNIPTIFGVAGAENFSSIITLSGLTVPVSFRLFPNPGGIYDSSSYCKVFKNGVLLQQINTNGAFALTDIYNFYNNDTLQFAFYTDNFTSINYILNIYRYRYAISNPLTVVSPELDNFTISLS